jgi:hypothetical protein
MEAKLDFATIMPIAICSIVIIMVLLRYKKFRDFYSKGTKTVATLEKIETKFVSDSDSNGKVKRFYPHYSYKTAEGASYSETPYFYIHKSKNNYSINDNPNIGTQLPARYLNSDPSKFILTDLKSIYDFNSFYLFFLFVAFIILCFRFGFGSFAFFFIGFKVLLAIDFIMNRRKK